MAVGGNPPRDSLEVPAEDCPATISTIQHIPTWQARKSSGNPLYMKVLLGKSSWWIFQPHLITGGYESRMIKEETLQFQLLRAWRKKLKQLALNFEGLTWTIEWKELDVRNPQKSEHWEFQEKEIKGHRNVVCLPFVETKSVKYVGQILCNKTHLNKEAIYSAGPTRTTMHSPGARIPIPATVNRAGKWFPVAYKHCGCTGLLEWVNTSIWDQWNCISCGHLLPLLYRHSTFPHSSRFSPSSYTTNDYPLVLKHDTEHVAHF